MTMIDERTWEEFSKTGLLWFVNRLLHVFGWAIVLEVDEDDRVSKAYPATTRFRGFDGKTEDEGFRAITEHITSHESVERMRSDIKDGG